MAGAEYYFLVRQNLDEGFWKSEIESTLLLFGHAVPISKEDCAHFPFIRIRACTEECAQRAGQRSIMVKQVLQVFALGHTVEDVKPGFLAMGMKPAMPNASVLGSKKHAFPYDALLEQLGDLPSVAQVRLYILNPAAQKEQTPLLAFAAKQLGEGCYDLVTKYKLKTRNLLGPTSLTSELSFLMANLGLVRASSLVLDPYFGTGGALIAAVHFKAQVFGLDIDWRMLKEGMPFQTFDQYALPRPDVIRGDFSRAGRPMRAGVKLDAIIADPPYGIRAGARKTGENGRAIKPEFLDSHIPQMQKYESDEVIKDLLDAAHEMLVPGGRLVYLFPVESIVWQRSAQECLPKRDGLRLLYAGHDQLRLGMSRILVTMEKLPASGSSSSPALGKKQRLEA